MKKGRELGLVGLITLGSFLLTSPHNVKQNVDKMEVDLPEPSGYSVLVGDISLNIDKGTINEIIEYIEKNQSQSLQYAYLSDISTVYDKFMNEIDTIDKFQKIIIVDESGSLPYITYVDNNNEVRTGYIFDLNIRKMPNTFIEVDLGDQRIRMYIDGELVLESVIVSGLDSVSPTQTGYFEIYYKEEHATLKSYYPDGSLKYASYVDYWMPFDGGIGLHDAEYHYHLDGSRHGWRESSEFGGQTYLHNGSHGCVNLLHDTAEFIYENSEIGTKVLVHK